MRSSTRGCTLPSSGSKHTHPRVIARTQGGLARLEFVRSCHCQVPAHANFSRRSLAVPELAAFARIRRRLPEPPSILVEKNLEKMMAIQRRMRDYHMRSLILRRPTPTPSPGPNPTTAETRLGKFNAGTSHAYAFCWNTPATHYLSPHVHMHVRMRPSNPSLARTGPRTHSLKVRPRPAVAVDSPSPTIPSAGRKRWSNLCISSSQDRR
ncbi:hypothetical protein C8Q80DRAFT_759641 [Daedaleopsis nitida]|nr:hypothetical protein C8Q80DRAFT_759641 [Daedaleopsis nitida]